MRIRRLRRERSLLVLLAVAGYAVGQTSPDPRLSLDGYSEDAKLIRFTIQNNHTWPITFYQVRLQAKCSDGAVVEAGGWSFDSTRTRATQPDLGEFAPIKIEPIDPGSSHRFEFIRPLDVSGATFSGQTAETITCQPSTLKDFTAIFADGSGIGVLELIDKQFVIWQEQQNELKHWLGPLHGLRAAPDPSAALNSLRDSLTHEYDDCEDRPLANGELTKCQINREVWHQVNGLRQRLRSSPQGGGAAVVRLVEYWDRVVEILEQQLSHRN